jgi:hypothetical protein
MTDAELHFNHVPLLQIARDLHDMPRNMERFQKYVSTVVEDNRQDIRYPPLGVMNPMGREHVAERLDALLAMDAEKTAEKTLAEALPVLAKLFPKVSGVFQHGFAIVDDVRGGWTNRYTHEYAYRCQPILRNHWFSTYCWVSEAPSTQDVVREVRAAAYRAMYVAQNGPVHTLHQRMTLIGQSEAFAGMHMAQYGLSEEELAYSREVLAPLLESTHEVTCIPALLGDTAAYTLGYPQLGLSDNAGLAVALADALATAI